MTKEQAIVASKTFRKDADELLQRMKEHTKGMRSQSQSGTAPIGDDFPEAIAQHIISTRDLESCIMRQGMALKYIGTPNPYPDSKDPSNTVVNPTADGLKL